MSVVAKQIAFLRSTLKLTQEDFAKNIGFSRSYVRDIELGKVKPSRRFLESINRKFGISIDQLLMDLGERITNILNKIPQISQYGFIYLYDFTDKGLKEAEKQLVSFLSGFKYVMIEGKEIKSENHLFSLLTGIKGPINKLYDYFMESRDYNEYTFFIIKNYSLSGIRNKAATLRILSNILCGPSSSIIIIDKPAFLERNISLLYYWAYPIHTFGSFGRVNY